MKAFGIVKKSPKKLLETSMIITKEAPKIEVDSIKANQESVLDISSRDGSFHELTSNRKFVRIDEEKSRRSRSRRNKLFNQSGNLDGSMEKSSISRQRSLRKKIFEPRQSKMLSSRLSESQGLKEHNQSGMQETPVRMIESRVSRVSENEVQRPSRKSPSPRKSIFEKQTSRLQKSGFQIQQQEFEVRQEGCFAGFFSSNKKSESDDSSSFPVQKVSKRSQDSLNQSRQEEPRKLKQEFMPSQSPIAQNDVEESVANSKVARASSGPPKDESVRFSKPKPPIKIKNYRLEPVKSFAF